MEFVWEIRKFFMQSIQPSQIKPDYLYRSGVGIMLINQEKKIFVGKRIDNNSDAWQMPQGGADPGEEEDVAMFRELHEETGIISSAVKVIKKVQSFLLQFALQFAEEILGWKIFRTEAEMVFGGVCWR